MRAVVIVLALSLVHMHGEMCGADPVTFRSLVEEMADIDALTPHLARLDIVTLNFPGFADGRAFSQARSIRHTEHFTGTIRARGGFLPDQYGFLLQSGVDSFEVSDRFPLDEWVRHAGSVPATYQRDYATGGLATRPFAEAGPRQEQPHFG